MLVFYFGCGRPQAFLELVIVSVPLRCFLEVWVTEVQLAFCQPQSPLAEKLSLVRWNSSLRYDRLGDGRHKRDAYAI